MSASSPNVPYVGGWVACTYDGDPFAANTLAHEGQVLGRVIATREDGVKLHNFRWVPWRFVRPCPPPTETGGESNG